MNKVAEYIKDSYLEFRNHVTWPAWKELQSATIVVVIGTLALALVLAGVDYVFSSSITGLFKSFK